MCEFTEICFNQGELKRAERERKRVRDDEKLRRNWKANKVGNILSRKSLLADDFVSLILIHFPPLGVPPSRFADTDGGSSYLLFCYCGCRQCRQCRRRSYETDSFRRRNLTPLAFNWIVRMAGVCFCTRNQISRGSEQSAACWRNDVRQPDDAFDAIAR